MEELYASLKIVLANTFVMYFKSHAGHWNIEGPNFSAHHAFLDGLYNELHDAVDPIAEHIRAIDEYAPYSLMDLYNAKTVIEDSEVNANSLSIFASLRLANDEVITSLNKAYELANYHKQNGLSNFLQDRLDVHAKWGWQIRSHLK